MVIFVIETCRSQEKERPFPARGERKGLECAGRGPCRPPVRGKGGGKEEFETSSRKNKAKGEDHPLCQLGGGKKGGGGEHRLSGGGKRARRTATDSRTKKKKARKKKKRELGARRSLTAEKRRR